MRGSSILQGPDDVFHLVCTTSWQGKTTGYASLRDLKTWPEQRAISVVPEALNCWAPDMFYDAPSREFVIVGAPTVLGEFPETLGKGPKDYNHRLYAVRAREFATFPEARDVLEGGE